MRLVWCYKTCAVVQLAYLSFWPLGSEQVAGQVARQVAGQMARGKVREKANVVRSKL